MTTPDYEECRQKKLEAREEVEQALRDLQRAAGMPVDEEDV